MSCCAVLCSVLFRSVLFCSVLFCSVAFCCVLLCCIVLCCLASSCVVLCCVLERSLRQFGVISDPFWNHSWSWGAPGAPWERLGSIWMPPGPSQECRGTPRETQRPPRDTQKYAKRHPGSTQRTKRCQMQNISFIVVKPMFGRVEVSLGGAGSATNPFFSTKVRLVGSRCVARRPKKQR